MTDLQQSFNKKYGGLVQSLLGYNAQYYRDLVDCLKEPVGNEVIQRKGLPAHPFCVL